jgi:DNA-binding response OmpR family regulator
MQEIKNDKYDIYLLDINVPKINGLDICVNVRSFDRNTPIIIISAYGDISEKTEAFHRFADDYLVKPFYFEELMLRMESLIRRKNLVSDDNVETIKIENLVINKTDHKVFRGGKEINLTLKEYQLLLLLAEHSGKIFSKQQISEMIWDLSFSTNTNTIEVYINFLRKKIDRDFNVKLIHTRSGFGYYLKAEQ